MRETLSITTSHLSVGRTHRRGLLSKVANTNPKFATQSISDQDTLTSKHQLGMIIVIVLGDGLMCQHVTIKNLD